MCQQDFPTPNSLSINTFLYLSLFILRSRKKTLKAFQLRQLPSDFADLLSEIPNLAVRLNVLFLFEMCLKSRGAYKDRQAEKRAVKRLSHDRKRTKQVGFERQASQMRSPSTRLSRPLRHAIDELANHHLYISYQ